MFFAVIVKHDEFAAFHDVFHRFTDIHVGGFRPGEQQCSLAMMILFPASMV